MEWQNPKFQEWEKKREERAKEKAKNIKEWKGVFRDEQSEEEVRFALAILSFSLPSFSFLILSSLLTLLLLLHSHISTLDDTETIF